ncbi:MAG: hypothetical protein ACR2RL_26165, partial [Gammaproteobacteria bacterium]
MNLEEVVEGEVISRRAVMTRNRPETIRRLEDLGLDLEDGKALLADLQAAVVEGQFERDNSARATCLGCGAKRRLKGYRRRTFDTVYGRVTARRARYQCTHCQHQSEAERLTGRSTPELNSLRAKWAAHLPYRVARDMLREVLPVSGGVAHTTIRNHTLAAGQHIEQRLSEEAASAASPAAPELTLGLDTAYIRACSGHPTRHVNVLVGEAFREGGEHRYFASIEQDSTVRHSTLIRANLKRLGFVENTEVTVLTDGEDALRMFARQATGKAITPILDFFHIAMRVQHLKQLAKGLS